MSLRAWEISERLFGVAFLIGVVLLFSHVLYN